MSKIPEGAITQAELRQILCNDVGGVRSHAAWASAHSVSVRALGMTLDHQRGFSPSVAYALGYMPVEIYVPIPGRTKIGGAHG